jgi:hypothetical protein
MARANKNNQSMRSQIRSVGRMPCKQRIARRRDANIKIQDLTLLTAFILEFS